MALQHSLVGGVVGVGLNLPMYAEYELNTVLTVEMCFTITRSP
jgi:phosphate/sulfate permease